jgi:hypothetical protein
LKGLANGTPLGDITTLSNPDIVTEIEGLLKEYNKG